MAAALHRKFRESLGLPPRQISGSTTDAHDKMLPFFLSRMLSLIHTIKIGYVTFKCHGGTVPKARAGWSVQLLQTDGPIVIIDDEFCHKNNLIRLMLDSKVWTIERPKMWTFNIDLFELLKYHTYEPNIRLILIIQNPVSSFFAAMCPQQGNR